MDNTSGYTRQEGHIYMGGFLDGVKEFPIILQRFHEYFGDVIPYSALDAFAKDLISSMEETCHERVDDLYNRLERIEFERMKG